MIPPAGDALDLGKLSEWAPELARTFVALSSDIALVMDGAGVILQVEHGRNQPIAPLASSWIGRSWVDTVSSETRAKIEKLLDEASSTGIAKSREVNHTLKAGVSIPVAYTAVRLGEGGPVLAVGRDMRAISAIQERFIESQQDMERGYWRARQAEARYQVLFQVSTDAVIVVDPETLLILDANPAAATLLSSAGDELVGKHAAIGFAHDSRGAFNELLATARTTGRSGEIRVRLVGSAASTHVAATSFRAEEAMRLLVRIRAAGDASGRSLDGSAAAGAGVASGSAAASHDAADGAVVTDSSGRILLASPAFLKLVQLPSEAEVKGRPLVDLIGTSGPPLGELISKVRRQGVVRSFPASAKPMRAPAEPIDVSASLLTDGDQECIGFSIHRAPPPAAGERDVPPSLGIGMTRLAGQLGDVPLARLVAEASALAEQHFVELALLRSGGDAAEAAALLGVSPERVTAATSVAVARPNGSADSSGT